jgi:hypothetical protein
MDIDLTMVAQLERSLSHGIAVLDVQGAPVLCRMRGKLVLAAAVLLTLEGCDAAPLGTWDGVIQFPLVPVAAALLPDGKVSPTLQSLAHVWHAMDRPGVACMRMSVYTDKQR